MGFSDFVSMASIADRPDKTSFPPAKGKEAHRFSVEKKSVSAETPESEIGGVSGS